MRWHTEHRRAVGRSVIARWAAAGMAIVAVTAIVLLRQPHHHASRYADYLKAGTTSSQCPSPHPTGGWTFYLPLDCKAP